jgi:hypothetical protein
LFLAYKLHLSQIVLLMLKRLGPRAVCPE